MLGALNQRGEPAGAAAPGPRQAAAGARDGAGRVAMNISLLAVFRRDLVCQQVVEMVTADLEDALSRLDRRRLEKHLAGCPLCTESLAQTRETIRLAGRLEPEDLSPEMRSDLTEGYLSWLPDRQGARASG